MSTKNTSKAGAENSESTALANPGTNNVPAQSAPSFMAGAKDGKENIDRGDMIIPRVALMQSTHQEVEEDKVKAGQFWHTILEEDLGDAIDDLVIIHHSKRWNLWKPRHEGGGILARASDGRYWDKQFRGMEFEVAPSKDRPRHKVKWKISEDGEIGRDIGLGAWGSSDPENEDSQPAATLSHVLVCVSLSRLDMGPFVILLQRTAEKVGRNLLTKIGLDAAPIYGQVYRMGVKSDSNASGDYKQYSFTKNGWVPDKDLFDKLQAMFVQFDDAGVKYDDTTDAGDGDATGGGAGAGDAGAPDATERAGGRQRY